MTLALLAALLALQEAPAWENVKAFLYQLQGLDIDKVGASKFDLVITDFSRDGTEAGRWTAKDVDAMRKTPKLVLAYLSIGEAETYRWYWKNKWDADGDGRPDKGAPDWLGPVNPDWPGNHKVRYWDPKWQQIVFAYLDKILEAGFDGAYLDIIDGYEFWGPEGNGERKTAGRDMVDFVKAIAERARKKKPGFGVFPQNGDALARHDDYVKAVTGIGREDLFYDGNKRQPARETKAGIANLDVFRKAGKLVLVTDYVTRAREIDDFYRRAKKRGFVPYATVRELNKLTVNQGHEPRVAHPIPAGRVR